MADEYFKRGQSDVLERLNSIKTLLQTSGNAVNPVFQSFGGAWSIPDVRVAGKKLPQDYRNYAAVIEFNDSANFDSVPTHNSGFGYVMTVVGSNSNGTGGGGFPVQLSFAESLSVRRGSTATSWTQWKKIASYDDGFAVFGSQSSVGQSLIVGGDNASVGASFRVQTGGSTVIAFGNKSAIVGGGFDNTPYLFGRGAIECSVGMSFGGQLQARGIAELIRLADDGALISFCRSSGDVRTAYIQSISNNSLIIMPESGSNLRFGSGGNLAAEIDLSGNFRPVVDGVKYNGVAALRWAALYSVTGAIQTSDGRKKTSVTAMTPAMRAAAREMLPMLGTYQWLDSVKEKGADKARLHVGFTVQQAVAILEKHGIDPFSMAFICHDEWPAEYENRRVNEGEKVTKLRIVQKQKTRTVQQPQDVVELINGKPVLVRKVVDVTEPVFDELPVLYEDGSPVMLDEHTPMLHRVPVMETVQEPYEADAEPKYEKVLVREAGDCFAFRYDQLTLFMLSALAE